MAANEQQAILDDHQELRGAKKRKGEKNFRTLR